MRLFVALGIPEDVRKKLADLKDDVNKDCAKIKWVETGNIHLTLKFLGETDVVDEIKENLDKISAEKFTMSISGTGAFPNENRVRVIWAGARPEKTICCLQKSIEESLSHLGFAKDSKFHPHVTLGRVRFVKDMDTLGEGISRLKAVGKIGEFPVEKFTLKKSTLTPEGPVYEDVAVFELD